MSRCGVFASLVLVQFERYRKCVLQHRKHTTVKLVEIGFPCAVRINPVCPTNILSVAKMFPIVREKVRAAFRIGNTAVLPKHQHPSHCITFLACGSVFAIGSNAFQKMLVVKIIPRMVLMSVLVCLTIVP